MSRHSLIDMTVKAKGDLHIDDHHTVEDTGIALGQAIAKALGERRGITRYASIDLAMDETLTSAAVDVSGRPFLVWNVAFSSPKIGTFDTELVREFFQALSAACRHHAACHQSLRRQQPPHRRDLLQGGGACAAHGAGARSAPGRRGTVDQGHAEGITGNGVMDRHGAAGGGRAERSRGRCSSATASRCWPSCCRRSGCCGTGCGSRPRWRSRRCWSRPGRPQLTGVRNCRAAALAAGLAVRRARRQCAADRCAQRRGWRLGRGRSRQSRRCRSRLRRCSGLRRRRRSRPRADAAIGECRSVQPGWPATPVGLLLNPGR